MQKGDSVYSIKLNGNKFVSNREEGFESNFENVTYMRHIVDFNTDHCKSDTDISSVKFDGEYNRFVLQDDIFDWCKKEFDKGARVGMKFGNIIMWSDGTQYRM
jgi:hypothetical protein